MFTDNEDITLAQRTGLDQNGGNRAAAHIQLRLNHSTCRSPVRVSFQFKNLSLKRDGFQQVIQPFASNGRDFDILHIARHLLNNHLMLQQVGTNLVRVGFRFIDLVDRYNHRDLGRFGVVNRFDGLRHNRIVSSYNQNHDIGDLGTA